MDRVLADLLNELENYGKVHDATITVHAEQMLNITPETGMFLSILVQALRSKSILEIGTSDGYSTLWFADAVGYTGGKVTTVEVSEKKAAMAGRNFGRSGLSDRIALHVEDIREFLKKQEDESFDFVFLDAERPQYVSYWKDLDRVLKTGSILVVDNALSPHPEELAEFFGMIEHSSRYVAQTLQIGKGECLALKQSAQRR